MIARSATYAALACALAPPGGDAAAFGDLRLSRPDADALASEHVKLLGRVARPVVSPYEGVYRRTPLHTILAAYATVGLAPDQFFRDRPDHVSAELACLAELTEREERSARDADPAAHRRATAASRAFFLAHVAPWVPAFFERVSQARDFPLHRPLAAHALGFLGQEPGRRDESAPPITPRPQTPLCTTCGRPLGVLPPDRDGPRPPWASTCIRCRVRADLRRTVS